MTTLAQYYSYDIHDLIGKDFPYYERSYKTVSSKSEKRNEKKKKTKARIAGESDWRIGSRFGVEDVKRGGKFHRSLVGEERENGRADATRRGLGAVFAKLTWEADRRMCLGVVRVVGVPRGCCTLPAEAEDRRRDQACHAQDQKHQPDHEPDRLHTQDRRCLRVCGKV